MSQLTGMVQSLHVGAGDALDKTAVQSIELALDGIVGDRHRGSQRAAWEHGDKQPAGTLRRNERQWSAVSVEELETIRDALDLDAPLQASDLGANLCLSGIAELSRLPKGSLLIFPSGAVLVVEEFNPPCLDMGRSIAAKYRRRNGEPPADTDFSKAAKLTRGVVGVVDVPGMIHRGDAVQLEVYATPAWLERSEA
ncbi:MAG: MOSC domain-containing protein [Pseudomonadota bacterium]